MGGDASRATLRAVTLFDSAAGAGPAKVRMVVAYDGSDFHGFAESHGVRTVAGALRGAIERVTRRTPELSVAGRTDKGVHAWGNVVSYEASPGLDPWRVQDALNSMLGPEVVVRECDLVDGSFDARHSAIWRRYRYTILNRPVPDPFRDRFALWVAEPLDLRSMRAAADPFVGEHDFTSFCRRGPEGSSPTRRVLESRFEDHGDGVLVYEIRANAFCWQMVRSIVGTLVEVGRGKRTPGDMLAVIRARERAAAGQLAPAKGLCLWEVGYAD
jgi:tRNA pseudouridine38-40 synthase